MPRPAPGTRADYAHFRTIPTRWQDNDGYGHMNNVIHYVLFDTAISLWQAENGIFTDFGAVMQTMVAESGCRYHGEAAFPDLIHVGLKLGHLGRSSWRYDIGLFRNDDHDAFAEGFFTQVQIARATGKPEPLDAATREVLERLQM